MTRHVPANWPPEQADVWRIPISVGWDAQVVPVLWFAVAESYGDRRDLKLVPADRGHGIPLDPDRLLARAAGTPELVWRADPAAAPVEREAGDPTHDAIASGLRRLADLIERHPDLPVPPAWHAGANTGWPSEGLVEPALAEQIARVERWAAVLGVEMSRREVDNRVFYGVSHTLDGVFLNISCIENRS
jgi:hypothetical protein